MSRPAHNTSGTENIEATMSTQEEAHFIITVENRAPLEKNTFGIFISGTTFTTVVSSIQCQTLD